MKNFNGKTIYNPYGKAGEYSYWACNGCTYCYLKKGVLKRTMGGDAPTLKKCFNHETHALEIFEKELKRNLPKLQKYGLFFTFTSDQFLPETKLLTECAIGKCLTNNVPVKILTKRAEIVNFSFPLTSYWNHEKMRKMLAFGFTLTGHDELEQNGSTNAERIEAMRKLHDAGFKTWASIEPIIDFESSFDMVDKSWDSCDIFKIGLQSGKKYDKTELNSFVNEILSYRARRWRRNLPMTTHIAKLYFKDSLCAQAGIKRELLPDNCVGRDYNIFNS